MSMEEKKIRIEEPNDEGVKEEEHFMECYGSACPLYDIGDCARAEKIKKKV